ncbi:hypothetical protein G7046_g6430 [Stylonectria norvegica]|nr:hypothetical protein G7046_g6430 [Stylonectria norvegica]
MFNTSVFLLILAGGRTSDTTPWTYIWDIILLHKYEVWWIERVVRWVDEVAQDPDWRAVISAFTHILADVSSLLGHDKEMIQRMREEEEEKLQAEYKLMVKRIFGFLNLSATKFKTLIDDVIFHIQNLSIAEAKSIARANGPSTYQERELEPHIVQAVHKKHFDKNINDKVEFVITLSQLHSSATNSPIQTERKT